MLVLVFCQFSLAGTVYTDLTEVDSNDPNWVVVTSNLILRESICDSVDYERAVNPCDGNDNKYWLLPAGGGAGHAFPITQIQVDTIESLYVDDNHWFQLYYNSDEPADLNDLEPASAPMKGPMYVTVDFWRDISPPPSGFEPNTFFVSGGPGELGNYSITVREWTSSDDLCHIENGSFEYDQQIADVTSTVPQNWDVNFTTSSFDGHIDTDWVTDGLYNLTLQGGWGQTVAVDDVALLGQQVCFTDVNEILFDLKLETLIGEWDPSVCVPVLMIDSNVVWEPNSAISDIRGTYLDESYTIEEKYKTGTYTLSVGLKSKTAGALPDSYISQWDNIELTSYCGGFGLLAGDSNRDCFVDFYDLEELGDLWLGEVSSDAAANIYKGDDVSSIGYINMLDIAVLGEDWMKSSY